MSNWFEISIQSALSHELSFADFEIVITISEIYSITGNNGVISNHKTISISSSAAGGALDAIDSGLTILDYILRLPGKCCPSASKVVDGIGNWCVDGSKGTPYCAHGGCNIQGCNCDGGCRTPPDDSIVAIMYEGRNFNKGAFNNGADKAFTANSNTCVNFGYFNDKISGIIPANGCVKVWENGGCEGASACFCEPIGNLGRHEMRSGTSWEDQISSMSKC